MATITSRPDSGNKPAEPRRHRVRTSLLIVLGAVLALAAIGGIVSAFGPSKTAAPAPTKTKIVYRTSPPKTVIKTVPAQAPAPTQAVPVQQAPAAPPKDTILANFRGTGSGNTGTFTVPADGNWHLSWAFTNGSLFAGQAENFQVYEYTTDGTLDQVLVNSLAIGNGQPTADPVYGDSAAGRQVYFQVNTEDASWNLVPVSGTS